MRTMIRRAIPASNPSRSRRADRAKTTEYSTTPTLRPAPRHALLHSLQRFSRLGGTLLGEGPVIEVFPQSALLLEVDLNGRLPAEAVNDEPNAFYHRISLSRASETFAAVPLR